MKPHITKAAAPAATSALVRVPGHALAPLALQSDADAHEQRSAEP